LLNKFVLDDEN